jgi:hypothetical protein
MTKKDYILIADVIRELKIDNYGITTFHINAIENLFLKKMKENNPNFDCDKFRKYINEN